MARTKYRAANVVAQCFTAHRPVPHGQFPFGCGFGNGRSLAIRSGTGHDLVPKTSWNTGSKTHVKRNLNALNSCALFENRPEKTQGENHTTTRGLVLFSLCLVFCILFVFGPADRVRSTWSVRCPSSPPPARRFPSSPRCAGTWRSSWGA